MIGYGGFMAGPGVGVGRGLSNRDKALEPRGKGFWCSGCDARIVAEGQKCRRCGVRSGKRRFKR